MKKNKLNEVKVMEGINFDKAHFQQRKNDKTRRIKAAELKRKMRNLKIALYISIAINILLLVCL